MTLNFLPSLRKRASYETDKATNAASEAAQQARHTVEDAGQRIAGLELPTIDVRGTIDSARKILGDARKTLGEGGDQVAHGAQQAAHGAQQAAQRAGQVSQDLRGRVDDLRALEIRRRRRDPWPGLALIAGIVGGISAMFLFDPQDGKRRRALLRDKLGKWTRLASETAQGRAKDLRNRSQGLIHETREMINSKMPGAETENEAGSTTATQSEWPAQEPVGAAAGGESRTPSYSDVSHQPGAANGREG